jgi:hypothetical protein
MSITIEQAREAIKHAEAVAPTEFVAKAIGERAAGIYTGTKSVGPLYCEIAVQVCNAIVEAGGAEGYLAALDAADQLAYDNIIRSGLWELRPCRWSNGWEWDPINGGSVFPCREDGTGLSPHALAAYGHLAPPCSVCGIPINAQTAASGTCFSCNHWAHIAETQPDRIVIADSWTHRTAGGGMTKLRQCMRDRGHRPNERDRSLLGFGGAEWRLRDIRTGDVLVSNNLWSIGGVPAEWEHAFPVTHEAI